MRHGQRFPIMGLYRDYLWYCIVKNSLLGNYIGAIWDPDPLATRLHMRSFDRSSYRISTNSVASTGLPAQRGDDMTRCRHGCACWTTQRVHAGIWPILRLQRGAYILTLGSTHVPQRYLYPLGYIFPAAASLMRTLSESPQGQTLVRISQSSPVDQHRNLIVDGFPEISGSRLTTRANRESPIWLN